MSSNIFNWCVHQTPVDTFVEDRRRNPCAHCLFNKAEFIYTSLLTHPPSCTSKPAACFTPFHRNVFSPETVRKQCTS